MILFNNISDSLCLFLVVCQILETRTALSNFFSDTKVWISNICSKAEISIPTFSSFVSLCHKKLNTFTLIADGVTMNFIGSFKTLIHNSEDFLTYISKNNSLWHCWPFSGFYSNPYSVFNATAFELLIKYELYGQHLVHWSIGDALEAHILQDNPCKPLIMSFHGPTGSGKSFVSKLIAESLYLNGYKSECVHVYHGSLDFLHESKKHIYQKRLLKEIAMFTHICKRSLLIFDEMDKMVPGIIDVLLPWIVFEKSLEIDIRKNIFIFISQTGAKKIEEICYDGWLDGIPREDMSIEEFSVHLKEVAYNVQSGLQHSELVKKNLIDVFVPFLPLEKDHIKQCIIRELRLRQLPHNSKIVEKVADQFDYEPPEFPLFSASGCKKVSNKVDLYGEDI